MKPKTRPDPIPAWLAGSAGAACLALFGQPVLAAPPGPVAAKPAPAGAYRMPAIRHRQLTTRIVRSGEGLDYTIFVSAPEGPPPPGGFPVIYVLDANAWFGAAAEIARLNELEGGPAIVVGVGYPVDTLYDPPRRAHDFTLGPPVTPQSSYAGADFGGADAFLRFLRVTLRDDIGRSFEINRRRQTLFGHSLGGYFVLHALFSQPDAFDVFVAASPAIWWDAEALAKEEARFEAAPPNPGPRVLITVGGSEQELSPADVALFHRLYAQNPAVFGGKTLEATLAETRRGLAKDRMVDNAREVADRLGKAGVQAQFAPFPGENHRSEVPSALSRTMGLALGGRS
jgi:predicted alpha/beta superfamily hydrolase